MLYKKNSEKILSKELFKNPTCEYRATPFWSWNCKLNRDLLTRQIEYLKEMGFGGFHMHSRSGMATKYLGEEFMDLVKSCVEKAKDEDMLAWLYDEDRWASGAAGGYVTKDPKFRQKYILFTLNREENTVSKEEGTKTGKTYFIAAYDVSLNESGELARYKKIEEADKADGEKWYVYVKTAEPTGWFNNQGYVDTLSNEAIDRFIDITYNAYDKCIGDEFGSRVPAIFTDEPQFSVKSTLAFADSRDDVTLPWTTDFADSFKETYGSDILLNLPELLWNLPNGEVSVSRYRYHDHICERFTKAFADRCGKWCGEHGIYLTGHMMGEQTLESQTQFLGEAMRAYRSFGIPGIDMLCDATEFSTAKQAQSAVHQYGKEGMLSELYGVTNWDFDFRDHKFQGDWQAALGVTVRVPHLSWVSMKGSAKRDYPASISYQSPWYKEYPYVEDHFARLNTALTRGKPIVNIGVIHPVESYWLHWGPSGNTAEIRTQMDNNFQSVINWLLFGLVDFDFISESLLPEQCGGVSDKLNVGKMNYSTVIVPGCETLRLSTVKLLKEFAAKGGKLIFVGECPKYIDAQPSNEVQELYNASVKAQFNKISLLDAVKSEKTLSIKNIDGSDTDNFIYSMRKDSGDYWLFIAHGKKYTILSSASYHGSVERHGENKELMPRQDTVITLNGEFEPELYDTITGEVKKTGYKAENGKTVINHGFYGFDSLLLKLTPKKGSYVPESEKCEKIGCISIKSEVEYSREEPNVYLLDMAEYALDGGDFKPLEEILRLDELCRVPLGYPKADGCDVQPWLIEEKKAEHFVTLKFNIPSETEVENLVLAAEEAESIMLNGENVPVSKNGWYVDESIFKIPLPNLKKGMNELIVKMPLTERIGIEYCYLLGEFDVKVQGTVKTITAPSGKIGFGSITSQGMPFYGGNVVYKTQVETPDCDMVIRANYYRGSLIKVLVDGKDAGAVVYAPYKLKVPNMKAGKHTVEFVLYGNRHNTFGSLHNISGSDWYGPAHWYRRDEGFVYEYQLKDTGIMSSPVFEFYN